MSMDNPDESQDEINDDSEDPVLAEKQQETRRKRIQFAAGFLGFFIFNSLPWLIMDKADQLILLPLNLILLIVLAAFYNTRFISLGILAAMTVNFIITLVMGMGDDALCFNPFFVIE